MFLLNIPCFMPLCVSQNASCIVFKCAGDGCRHNKSGWVHDLNTPLSAIK